jgi:hypothetical protein
MKNHAKQEQAAPDGNESAKWMNVNSRGRQPTGRMGRKLNDPERVVQVARGCSALSGPACWRWHTVGCKHGYLCCSPTAN